MKNIYLVLTIFLVLQSCKSQQKKVGNSALQIENYTNQELEIMVTPFGLDDHKISVGSISTDGIINFDWPEIDLYTIEISDMFMGSINKAVGMNFCNDKDIENDGGTAKAVRITELSLYRDGEYVGSLYPATDIKIKDNGSLNRHSSLVLGSSLQWYYSDSDAVFKATCIVSTSYEGAYDFRQNKSYNIQFKKGWNVVQHTLLEKEDWNNETNQGSLPKKMTNTSVTEIPTNIKWFVKYFGQ